jgi:Ni/Co efflux regulator RcnB
MTVKTFARALLALTLAAAPMTALAQDGGKPAPLMARPAIHAVADCDVPAKRTEIVGRAETTLQGVMAYMEDYNRHAQATAKWRMDQMVAKGGWTQQEAGAFASGMLKDPTFEAMGKDNMKSLEGLMAVMTPFMEATKSQDELKTCRTMAEFVGAAFVVIDTTEKQWRYMNGRIDAAAKAKGVKLD